MSPLDVWAPTSPILVAVQTASLFNDSKDFVDAPLLVDPDVCWERWSKLPQPVPRSTLQTFVDTTFGKPDNLLVPWRPPDFTEDPPLLDRLPASGKLRPWAKALNGLWLELGRKVPEDLPAHRSTLLPVAHGFIVPGGRFREAYYWDSYWVVLGLLAVDMRDTAGSVTANLLDAVKAYGFVPNGLRSYYLNRSQPPMLTQMVASLVDYDLERGETPRAMRLLSSALPILEREYEWWMRTGENASVVRPAAPPNGPASADGCAHDGLTLNRYVVPATAPRVESYREDEATVAGMNEPDRQRAFADLAAGAESGWDFSTRWLADAWVAARGGSDAAATAGGDAAAKAAGSDHGEGGGPAPASPTLASPALASIRTSAVAPVELNAILFRNELTLKRLHGLLGEAGGEDSGERSAEELARHAAAARAFGDAASNRLRAMDYWMWDGTTRRWHDVEWEAGRRLPAESAASYMPLWAGAYSASQAAVAADALAVSSIVQPGGVATTLVESGQQWDAPNAWPPLQQMLVEGLRACGTTAAATLAHTLTLRWLRSNWLGWNRTGHMHEKYDARKPGERGGGGEYTPQVGFGWTNGVVLWMLAQESRLANVEAVTALEMAVAGPVVVLS